MRRILAMLAGLLLGLPAAGAAEFPTRPLTIIVPYTAGGPSDVAVRALAEEMQKAFGQTVLIDNRPGGGTIIGTTALARAAPDGYTLSFAGGSFVVNAATRKNLPYDTLKDFRGITIFDDAPLDIVSSPNFPANNLAELLELARKQDLTFASAGPGSVAHMSGELLARETGVHLEHVAYPGDAAAFADVVSGRVSFRIGSWSDDLQHVRSGALKLIAVLYPHRLPDAPNTPTVAETVPSMANYPAGVFNGLIVPAKVPQDVVDKLSEGVKKAASSEAFKARITALGLYPRYTTPAEADAFLRNQVETWTAIARAAKIEME